MQDSKVPYWLNGIIIGTFVAMFVLPLIGSNVFIFLVIPNFITCLVSCFYGAVLIRNYIDNKDTKLKKQIITLSIGPTIMLIFTMFFFISVA
jgi:hypothetical protein